MSASYIESTDCRNGISHDGQSLPEIRSGKASMCVAVASRCLRKQNAIRSSRPKARLSGGTPF
jgi:hypothetical protein